MTIFTDGLRLEPENRGVTDYVASFGESLGATVSETLADSPVAQLAFLSQLDAAKGIDYSRMSGVDDAAAFGVEPAPAPEIPPPVTIDRAEIQSRIKAAGLSGAVKLDQDAIAAPALDLIINHARARQERETTIARGPQGFFAGGAQLATSFLVGAIDPINLASAFIPVVGELRYGKLLAGAGESLARRSAVRAGVGATEGAVGQAALEPLNWYAHTQEGRDFGMADVLRDLMFGAALGGALHPAGGAIADTYRQRQGRALYPFGPGEPFDASVAREPAHVTAPELAPADLPDSVHGVLGLIDTLLQEPSAAPVRIIEDLPPRAKEDAMRAAIAAVIDGEPVKVGQLLEAAAEYDPRIAESLSGEHLSGPPPQVTSLAHSFLHTNKGDVGAALREFDDYLSSRPDPDPQFADNVRAAIEAGLPEPKNARVSQDVATPMVPAQPGATPAGVEPGNTKIVLGPSPGAAPRSRGRAAANPETFSLVEHLASKGGLRADPELEAIYGGKRGPFVSGMGPLIRKDGMTLDEALRSAKEHGYLFDPHDADNGSAGTGGRTSMGLTPRDLLDHLDNENRGQKLYKAGHLEATKYDPDQEAHVVLQHIEGEFEAAGLKLGDIDPALLKRTTEIVHREGETDVLAAYERAIIEDSERYEAIANARDAAEQRQIQPDAGATSGARRPDPVDGGRGGRPGPGRSGAAGAEPSRDGSGDQRTPEQAWRELAATQPDVNDQALLEASRAADRLPAPPARLDERVAAAEKADAFAKQMYDMFADRLPEGERQRLDDLIKSLEDEHAVRKEAIELSGACLFGARA